MRLPLASRKSATSLKGKRRSREHMSNTEITGEKCRQRLLKANGAYLQIWGGAARLGIFQKREGEKSFLPVLNIETVQYLFIRTSFLEGLPCIFKNTCKKVRT